ncbi:hypothetical protein PISMIDRAFT_13126 [Pisolithus microcarpus 441]|uniref:Uncharacterized protein n=1 Tax=Pisolithus microcarpus 441 TaxID=765257 RepID=A0A0C9ZJW4_9AGAM|nr:hypothetical protein PISMIDRAFT_13126 [Pisolithus microcarpus 441]
MSSPNANALSQPPSSPVASTDHILALLRELTASVRDALSNHELLASLANVETSLCMSSVTAPPSAPMVATPMLPPITSPPAMDAPGALNEQDIPMDDTTTPSVDHPTVATLPDDPHSIMTPPSPTLPHPSSSSMLTPSSSPIHSLPPHDAAPNRDELTKPSPQGTPSPSTTVLVIPVNSLLVSRAQLINSRSGSHLNTKTEWRAFKPNWHLQLIPRDSKDGGYTVYPPVTCSTCIKGKAVCSSMNGVKCARCKVWHSVCLLYVSPPTLPLLASLTHTTLSSKTPMRAGPKPELSSLVKQVHLLPPSSSSSPVSNETPPPSSSTTHLPLTSRTSSSTDDSALAIALAIQDTVVAAIEAFDQALEEQGLSSKAQGKHRARD